MRIIGGALKGLRLNPPKNLPVRPTTDMAKEALFNILQNKIEFENIKVLDLFSGTGNISMEFASRGAAEVISVDRSVQCVHYLKDAAKQHGLNNIKAYKDDVFKYLQLETEQYDLVFADPPYDLNRIPEIPGIIFDKKPAFTGRLIDCGASVATEFKQTPFISRTTEIRQFVLFVFQR